jgi:hypothetical protein
MASFAPPPAHLHGEPARDRASLLALLAHAAQA